MDEFICPQCGFVTSVIREGYCVSCYENNQFELDRHNLEFDRWQDMSDAEREDAIAFEIR